MFGNLEVEINKLLKKRLHPCVHLTIANYKVEYKDDYFMDDDRVAIISFRLEWSKYLGIKGEVKCMNKSNADVQLIAKIKRNLARQKILMFCDELGYTIDKAMYAEFPLRSAFDWITNTAIVKSTNGDYGRGGKIDDRLLLDQWKYKSTKMKNFICKTP